MHVWECRAKFLEGSKQECSPNCRRFGSRCCKLVIISAMMLETSTPTPASWLCLMSLQHCAVLNGHRLWHLLVLTCAFLIRCSKPTQSGSTLTSIIGSSTEKQCSNTQSFGCVRSNECDLFQSVQAVQESSVPVSKDSSTCY